jgi:hypothetical protein
MEPPRLLSASVASPQRIAKVPPSTAMPQRKRSTTPPAEALDPPAGFPEIRTDLQRAAQCQWEPFFFNAYLQPAWREVVFACRARRLPLEDADELFQDLCLRLMREGRFRAASEAAAHVAADYRGHLPARYLQSRNVSVASARFRTYLKGVLPHVVLEARRKRRRERPSPQDVEPFVEQSVTRSLERAWVQHCLIAAARLLKHSCETARTRGQRRRFDILYRTAVLGESPGKIAVDLGIDRTRASCLLTQAQRKLLALLHQVSRVRDQTELKELLAGSGAPWAQALQEAAGECAAQPSPASRDERG